MRGTRRTALPGHGPVAYALRAPATAEVAVPTPPDGTPVTAAVQDGRRVVPVPVFTAERVTVDDRTRHTTGRHT